MRTSLIVAVSRNLVIGTQTGLPWRLSRDLQRFRSLTLGKPIIMGRKTLEMIGRPLDGRENIVLTSRRDFAPPGVHVVHSVDAAQSLAGALLERLGGDEMLVIGGGEVYRQFLPLVDRIYLTIVDAVVDGTTLFPIALPTGTAWTVMRSEHVPADDRNQYPHSFHVLDRLSAPASFTPSLPSLLPHCF